MEKNKLKIGAIVTVVKNTTGMKRYDVCTGQAGIIINARTPSSKVFFFAEKHQRCSAWYENENLRLATKEEIGQFEKDCESSNDEIKERFKEVLRKEVNNRKNIKNINGIEFCKKLKMWSDNE